MTTIDAAEPADLAGVRGIYIGRGTAAMFLHWWLTTGLVEESTPGRYGLTEKGLRVAGGPLGVAVLSA